MLVLLMVIIAVWLIILALILKPNRFFRDKLDTITKAKWRPDRDNLQIMLDNFRSFPEQWSVKRDSIAFPKEGAKKLFINFDQRNGLEYTLSAFDDRARPLAGHFAREFTQAMQEENARREKEAALRMFYPEIDGTLRLK